MGVIKQYDIATTGPNAALLKKVTRVDRREAPGVLFLGGPAHPAAPAAAGAASGLRVRNAMWENAKTLIGSGDEASLGSLLTVGASFTGGSGAKGLAERTAKGGLHVIVSQEQTLAIGPDGGASIQLDSALRAYMHANRTDQWYFSLWGRITRTRLGGIDAGLVEFGAGSSSTDYMLSLMRQNTNGTMETMVGSGNDDGTTQQNAGGTLADALVPVRRWNTGSGKPTFVQGSPWPKVGPSWGMFSASYNAASGAGFQNKLPSWIFYELVIENLTKSGRTWQEANQIDHDAFVAAFGTGGRYAGDTFTAPSTIA